MMIDFQCRRCRRVRTEDSPTATQGEWICRICTARQAQKDRTPHIPQPAPSQPAGTPRALVAGLIVALTFLFIAYLHDIEHFVQTSALSVCRAK